MGALAGYFKARLSKQVWDETKHARDKRGRFASRGASETKNQNWEAEDKEAIAKLTTLEGTDMFDLPTIDRDWEGNIVQRKIETPLDYIDAIRDTLTLWLATHTNPDANSKLNIDDYIGDGASPVVVAARKFDDDLQEALIDIVLEEDPNALDTFVYYRGLGSMPREDVYGDENDPREYFGVDDDIEIPEPEPISVDDLKETLLGSPDTDLWEAFLGEQYEYNLIEKTLVAHFPKYRKLMAATSHVNQVIGEVYSVVKQMERASDDPTELLNAALWGSHMLHVHGNIVRDYGKFVGLDYSDVNRVQQDSPLEVFGAKAMRDFYAGRGKRTPRGDEDDN